MPDQAFENELQRSQKILQVSAEQSVVEALIEAGIHIAVSCQQGVCCTCLTRVIAGEIEHRDLYLTPSEQDAQDQFLPCCSRAKSTRLIIDL